MIKCLYGGCPKTFIDEEVREYISHELYKKYRKFKASQIKLSNPDRNFINCPTPDCEELIDHDIIEPGETKLECEKGHKFCSKCMNPGWHSSGSKCKNYGDQLLRDIKKKSDAINYKQCPQCSIIIEKNEGCNQMKCLSCNFEFCWLCLKKYTQDHYAVYNFTGCPGMRFNTPERKKWWGNPFLKALWLLLSFFLGIFAFVFIILFFCFFGCAYEFVKCYTNKKTDLEDGDEDISAGNYFPSNNEYMDNHYPSNSNNHNDDIQNQTVIQEKDRCKENSIIGLLIFLGIICQPLYLIFYMLYGLMECYRRFSCWFYYVDY